MSLLAQHPWEYIHKPFGQALHAVGESRADVVVLAGDLGRWTDSDAFIQAFPERFFEMGMAEQNMTGVAAGLARTGHVPFIAGYGVFSTRRAFDQLANNIALDRANVKVMGFLPGLTTPFTTHQAIEDLAITRALPNMVVIDPGDAVELMQAIHAVAAYEGPVYMRSPRGQVPAIFAANKLHFEIGKAQLIYEGHDVALVSTGLMLEPVLMAARILAEQGVSAAVLHMSTLKPFDSEALLNLAGQVRGVVTAENHSIIGGLAGVVAETLARAGTPCRLEPVGLPDIFAAGGPFEYLTQRHHMTTHDIVQAAIRVLASNNVAESKKPKLIK